MSNDITTLGVIPARGGSKGIARKNVQDLCGKPLIVYTLEAAAKSMSLTRVVVSTEDAEIAEIARSHGIEVLERPEELATDDALAIDVMQHAVKTLKEQGKEYNYVATLQPTSPLRTSADIDACIAMAQKHNADSVMSMKKISDFAPEKLKVLKDEKILPLFDEEGSVSGRRQDGPDVYKRNCAIYLTRTSLIEQGEYFGKNSYGYVMPEERSIDINDETDLALATFWMNRHA